jgi:thiamine-monophosphate kinase
VTLLKHRATPCTKVIKVEDEDTLVKQFQRIQPGTGAAGSPNKSLQVAIGDDAAVWRPRAGHETILTCDWFLEGTHFLANRHPPESIGWKCLVRASSDVTAMGAQPRCFLLSLALPSTRTGAWLEQFLHGLKRASRALDCPIAGGDTTRRNEILINITVVGESKRGRAILRSGARAGDAIFVTGRLGEAEYGLRLLQREPRRVDAPDKRLRKHLFPEPRLAAGLWLAKNGLATAMVDLSDGLSSDLPRLCKASAVGARIRRELLPCVAIAGSASLKKFEATEFALHGGDDYELLFTAAPKTLARIPNAIGRVSITRIGEITSHKSIVLAGEGGVKEKLQNKGWDPFR